VIRLAVRVRREQAELVLAELLELSPGGVEEVQVGEETVEYAVYGAPGELPGLPAVDAAVGDALVEISTSETPDDWDERWKRFHRPILIEPPRRTPAGGHRVPALRVRPPWEAAGAGRGREIEEIVIDPGQAFGTGGHASTRLCLELLLELAGLEGPSGPLLDVGTGSGVLAIAAARLGFGPVLALDNERASTAAAQSNASINGVDIEVRRIDVSRDTLPWMSGARCESVNSGARPGPAGSLVVVANLLRPLLMELAQLMPCAPAHLLAGGLLRGEAGEVASAFSERLGLRVRARRERGEWAAIWLVP
jgi:ribosomal protein L11 methyltransferase